MLLLTHANIITLDAQTPQVTALAIENGRIVTAGETQALLDQYGKRAEIIDLHGKTILPGLTDAHLHLDYYARALQSIDCETPTRQACLQRVARFASKGAERPEAAHGSAAAWILGHGWNQNDWPEGFGSAADLDAIAPQQPVFLTAKSLHAAWANSAALRLAGIHDDSPDPQGGRLGRDAHGRITGILFESAMELVSQHIPEPSDEQTAEAIKAAQQDLWSMGVTGVHDFDRRRCFSALQMLHQAGELKLRVLKSIPLEMLPQAIELGLRGGFGDERLRIGQVKAFMDGALGPQTAAMLQPYENTADSLGMLLMDAEELFEYGRQASEAGLGLAVHAIGDRANHEVLQAFENLRAFEKTHYPGRARLPQRIEHVQLLHPQDVQRLGQLEIAASMQPVHATSDMSMAAHHWGERAALSYAWRSQLEHGAVLAFGSDAPVESPNPFWGLHAAVTRQRRGSDPQEEAWYPAQRVTLMEALQAYTLAPAKLAGWADRLGRLSPGYAADLLVLDQDPFSCLPSELWRIAPQKTMFAGEWVWEQ
jgi:predicted amidohydrolase YtcJ